MIPEVDTQLAAVIKSLGDNVLPALDAANPMAGEQLHLCLATLGIVKARLPLLHAYLRQDLRDNRALAQVIAAQLPAAAALLGRAVQQAEAALADPENGATQLEAQARALKADIAEALALARGSAAEAGVYRCVIDAQGPMILRSRSWALGMGFEPDPAQIPSLETLLKRPATT